LPEERKRPCLAKSDAGRKDRLTSKSAANTAPDKPGSKKPGRPTLTLKSAANTAPEVDRKDDDKPTTTKGSGG
jgi:hypothetical protein